jgi:hypothetical protein
LCRRDARWTVRSDGRPGEIEPHEAQAEKGKPGPGPGCGLGGGVWLTVGASRPLGRTGGATARAQQQKKEKVSVLGCGSPVFQC